METEIKKVLEKSNSEFAEIHIENRKLTSFSISNSEIEKIETKEVIGGNIRVLKNGQWGFVAFNNIDSLENYLKIAETQADTISNYVKEKRKISNYKAIKAHYKTEYKINPLNISLEEKYSLARRYDSILKKHKKLQNRKIFYADRAEKIYYGNTEGTLITQDKIFTGILIYAVAREADNIQIALETFGGYKGYEAVEELDEIVDNTGRIAEDMLNAKQIEGGYYTVVLDPKLAGVFAHEAFGHLSEADFIYENERLRNIMQLGKKFGPDELNIIDEGVIPGEAGLIFIDDEGVLPQKTYLIKNGVLNSRLHSRETAYKMNEELTGNARAINAFHQPIVRMTNTYIDKGKYSFEEIIDSIDDGIYAVDYRGGQTNLEMFTFSAARAYRIKNGKIKETLKNVVLTGNVFETLKNIEMIGNDLKLFGGLGGCGKAGQSPLPVSTGAPHIKIKNVLIGGT